METMLSSASREVVVGGEVRHRIGDGVEVVAGVADLVDEAVVDGMVIASQVEARTRAEADAATEERIVVPADEDAGLARPNRVPPVLDLPDVVVRV